ncbi:MAG TPA: class I SAM-dependent methyltransferase [Tepidisphaeraceae bacterium]
MAVRVDQPLPPHAVLGRYYRDPQQKRAFLTDIFDATAGDYDRVEKTLSFGSGRWYRRQALRRAGLVGGMRVLDVAMGTGLVTREIRGIVGPDRVIGLDPSTGMIGQALRTLDVRAVVGMGETLPFEDEAFDFVSLGYALRHLADLRVAFAEFRRVLKPGGRVLVLEITRPEGFVLRNAFNAYLNGVLPLLARATGSGAETRRLWRYYGETIDTCVPPAVILKALEEVGFRSAGRYVSLGLFSEFCATK